MKKLILSLVAIMTVIQCFALGGIASAKKENKVQDAYIYGQSVASAIRLTMDNTLEATEALKYFYLEYGEDCFEEFEQIGSHIVADHPVIGSMYIAPEGVIRVAYPAEVESSTIGFEMLKDPMQGPRAQLAIDTKEITVAGPHQLVEGGIGFIIRNPVFEGDAFKGFTIIVLDWDRFVDKILENVSDPASQYHYAVWKENRDETAVTDEDGFILRSSDSPISNKVDIEFEVPNDTWHLLVEPNDGWQVWREMIPSISISLLIEAIGLAMAIMFYLTTIRKRMLETEKRENEEKSRYMEQLSQALDRAQEADAAKSRFLSRMSHDIRTPLNGIIGLLEIDDRHAEDVKLLAENRGKMRVAARHLLALINDILDMSKLEDGKIELAREIFSPNELGQEVETLISQQAAEQGIRLEKRLLNVPENDWVYGSPLHVRQIFINIYSNCVKYNRPGGRIKTLFEMVSEDEKQIIYRWTISDTGMGMSEEYLKTLFEPFSQEHVDDSRSVYRGTGLGMSIVKGLVEAMNGRIEVESKVGVGTVFRVTIPFERADDAGQIELKQTTLQVRDNLEGLRILVVEDNELNAEIAQMLLTDMGAQVELAGNGDEACRFFEHAAPGSIDIILMDVMMPVMDGLTATREIRRMERPDAKTIPIIAMTANAFVEDIQKCKEAGMDAHLSKPLDVEKLIRMLSGRAAEVSGKR
ncbi:MAG: response regulator [Lachnospiraceae bacterium]|nr:response regulator [Lachnospiraceae bacterium]